MPDFEDMLIRTVSAVEMHNLSEVLPIDVHAWLEARKVKEEVEAERGRTEALKFCEHSIAHWKEKQATASGVRHIED